MFNNWKIFENILGFIPSEQIKEKLNEYYEILVEENAKYNLTRIVSEEEVYEKHFLDSLLFTKEFKISDQNILDIGSGPGFPGIVLKIFYPETEITLIDSNNKKVNFLNIVIEKLKLKKIVAKHVRAEELARIENEKYDIVVSRAVAYLDVILELASRFAKIDGQIILLKGPRADDEIKNSKNIDQKLKLNLDKKQIVEDTGFGERINLFYSKKQPTPVLYPRDYAKIVKESGKK
ncbi:16S rRNA (guanine(527)-N(7))-methyltransferase RsmG [Mesoplasma entomophilum]|uniref:16S rRNA (guanine(527)-N(7))-methyltransferase RsmG n=1 Tax=Mesoplasma entomophilum TaxID=2149 RepID=UPI000D042333|nr:16S rRNA (guanine(527)-N(7))-methyltransferase RsmG [Mesoplasma entomophilum]AVN60649.1 16S rRNA (guanine(527)-N(7))-methyltransferase RsmG [Mesoplasma entomophilum]